MGIQEQAQVKVGSVWIEEVIHAICRNCDKPLRRRTHIPGIIGGDDWYHPHNSFRMHNGYDCDPPSPDETQPK